MSSIYSVLLKIYSLEQKFNNYVCLFFDDLLNKEKFKQKNSIEKKMTYNNVPIMLKI